MTMTQGDEFGVRLARVRANTGRCIIMVGTDESFVMERGGAQLIARRRKMARTPIQPAALLGAGFVGMSGVALGQYLQFHKLLPAEMQPDPANEMTFVFVFALIVAFVMSQILDLTSKVQRVMQVLGVGLMFCGFHNFGHWLPGPMAAAFSADWVADIVAATPANSLRFGERYLLWSDAEILTAAVVAAVSDTPDA